MNELQAALKIVLANTFVAYFKSLSYHWNVEGTLFSQYHTFFGDYYNELYGAVDDIAEHVRALGGYAPISIVDLMSAKTIGEDAAKPATIRMMVSNIMRANSEVTDSLNKAAQLATDANDQGLLNFVADRLDKHAKHQWMLRASLNSLGE